MWKVELHSHCNEDPKDFIAYTAETLIDRCIAFGYHALAITMHGAVLERPAAYEYARQKNFLLIPGIEKWIEEKEVLLYNVTPSEVAGKMNFSDLRNLRAQKGESLFVMAPHPFYPGSQCLHRKLLENIELFDAIEHCSFYLTTIDFNARAAQIARQHAKPLVSTGDIHDLSSLDRSYCLVDAPELTVASIFESIRLNQFRNVHRAITMRELSAGLFGMTHDKLRRSLGIKKS